ncbi:MAG: hypothetical protein RKR03_09125 [Candidatus Competibacter sp.]|nr:hypothetical protein [Candidatus Competibacter sp.]MDS4060540.1 hypothetical protein [Candidatus Contendobacter sp.]
MIPGVCPDCGLRADLLVFAEQAGANAGLAAALALPPLLGGRILRYLRLFNPPRKAMTSAKATRLLTELAAAVDSGQVERRGVAHAAPVGLWAAALDAVLAQPPERLPLDGHGYLFAVAWNLAERAAGRQERQAEERLRHGERPAAPAFVPSPPAPLPRGEGSRDVPSPPAPLPRGEGGDVSSTARREASLRHARDLMGLLRPWMNPADSATSPTPTHEESPCSD